MFLFSTQKYIQIPNTSTAESKIKLKDVGLTLKRTIFYFLAAFKKNYFTSTLLGLITNFLRWYMKKNIIQVNQTSPQNTVKKQKKIASLKGDLELFSRGGQIFSRSW